MAKSFVLVLVFAALVAADGMPYYTTDCGRSGESHGSGSGSDVETERVYWVSSVELTWHEAETTCVSLGGHLASVHDEDQQRALEELDFSDNLWIGIHGIGSGSDKEFEWSDGSCGSYDAWLEPTITPADSCAVIVPHVSGWSDTSCTNTNLFVCEISVPVETHIDDYHLQATDRSFSSEQCSVIAQMAMDFETCLAVCSRVEGCNAVSIMDSTSLCELRSCDSCAYPDNAVLGVNSYCAGFLPSLRLGDAFFDSECTDLGTFTGTVHECTTECAATDGCTGFNYPNEGDECVLQGCTYCPAPTGRGDFGAYCLSYVSTESPDLDDGSWTEISPAWTGASSRRTAWPGFPGLTEEECKAKCGEGCPGVEWWQDMDGDYGTICFMILDDCCITEYTAEHDLVWPPYIFLKGSSVSLSSPVELAVEGTTLVAGVPSVATGEKMETESTHASSPAVYLAAAVPVAALALVAVVAVRSRRTSYAPVSSIEI